MQKRQVKHPMQHSFPSCSILSLPTCFSCSWFLVRKPRELKMPQLSLGQLKKMQSNIENTRRSRYYFYPPNDRFSKKKIIRNGKKIIHALAYTKPPANTEKLQVAETTMKIFSGALKSGEHTVAVCLFFKVKDKITDINSVTVNIWIVFRCLLLFWQHFSIWLISASPVHFLTLINAEKILVVCLHLFFFFLVFP